MPWTADEMKAKGAHTNPAKAAEIANGILASCLKRGGKNCERIAIATALARTNKNTGKEH